MKRPRRGKEWAERRLDAERDYCEACGIFLHHQTDHGVVRIHPPIHHIVAESFLLRFAPEADPHALINLMALCKPCHAYVLPIEAKLFRGDKMGFLQGMRKLNFPMARIEAALAFYGL